MNSADQKWMQRAIQLALKGKGQVAPNPLVGCVIVHEDQVIGEGYHEKYGGPHAEVNAINAIADKTLIPYATLYVTLEPCSHQGKTPPCADLIIREGFTKVVVGSIDPNHKVSGKGVAKLREHDIHVTVGVLRQACEEINPFFLEAHLHKKPYYLLKWAQSKDGFIFNPSKQRQLSGPESQKLVHQLRADYQGILIGKRTALNDNPSLTVRLIEGQNPIRIVLMHQWDPELEKGTLFQDQFSTLYLNTTKEGQQGNKEWILIPEENTWKSINKILLQRGIQSVMVEGGTQVLSQLIDENWWNEIIKIKTAIQLDGGLAAPDFQGRIKETREVGADQWIHFINHG